MRVFPDANVIIAAHQWPAGICAAVLERIYERHELCTSEVVIEEATRTLQEKFAVPAEKTSLLEVELRESQVVARPPEPYALSFDDPDDLWVLAAAVAAAADLLITGDKAFRALDEVVPELRLCTPREFLDIHEP